jgi:hypothetical protein
VFTVQEEVAYDKAILEHHNDHLFRHRLIYTRNSETLYKQAARETKQLWLSDMYKYCSCIYYIACSSAKVMYFRASVSCLEIGQ